jgi:hypothetical protein
MLTDGEGPDKVWLGAILEPKEQIVASWVAQGSPRRAGNGEGVGGDLGDGDSSNKMLLEMKVRTHVGYEVVQSISK